MDKIQEVLIKAGHKDLAQKYYKKIAGLNISLVKEAAFKIKEIEKCLKELNKIAKDIIVTYIDVASKGFNPINVHFESNYLSDLQKQLKDKKIEWEDFAKIFGELRKIAKKHKFSFDDHAPGFIIMRANKW